MNRTNIYLPDLLRDRLDERANLAGVSRAELIRRLLEAGLESDTPALCDDLDAITGSFGILQEWDGPPGRGPDGRSRHLSDIATN